MGKIPDRKNLESLSRTHIQRLCKENHIKANKRTVEMINALCDLVNGKQVPRPLRAGSARVGKGRPVLAGGSGARHATKVITRGAGRQTKVTVMLQEEPIQAEEDVAAGSVDPFPAHTNKARPISPINGVAGGSRDVQPFPLPTATPSHPSYGALESRIVQLEEATLAARISEMEVAIAQIPGLQDEVKRLQAERAKSAADIVLFAEAQVAGLEFQVKQLAAENGTLKDRVTELETTLRNREAARDPSMSRVISDPPEDNGTSDHRQDAKTNEDTAAAVGSGVAAPAKVELPDPSPSQPALGKRRRSLVETPDISVNQDGTEQENEGAPLAAYHRDTKEDAADLNQEQDAVDLDHEEDAAPFSSLSPGAAGSSFSFSKLPPFPFDDSGSDFFKDSKVDANMEAGVGSGVAAPAKVELRYPSPSQPALGKRRRSLVETPDISVMEDGAEQESEGHRVTKPLRKRPRLDRDEEDAADLDQEEDAADLDQEEDAADLGHEEDAAPFSFLSP
ncbi:hypothetical protein JB92DRAFT_3020114, partial [Gautieria morchelliformis]